ncbi:hypothetical protein BAUCODRAFT_152046 [Baudoinia panamericana UAMH 10762]|uniref:N-acetyltransferase domain-containing protein n=1 Tax=Baudoinia panamericana (strain UAMH 10762) TaxID=717646 RepID=M2MYA8_BAUPA|nr:uncharacterized protein BAUCODRAFT_152046 [Baudoinia panamericana UAMH 10762]EMC91649.1 hypothetical protein BAUCODRAFT_152046 [Baudoinia panamericana UAMH 10762]
MGDSVADKDDSAQPEDPLEGVPELKTYLTTDTDEKIAALKLVADSVAQMRQAANNALISSPLNMACAVAIVALWARFIYDFRDGDITLAGITSFGIIMAFLGMARVFTKDYVLDAEAMKWEYLDDCDVMITKFGDEVIGTVVMEWVSGEGRQKRKKAWRGEIKAWTVRLKYRKKGVGSALLEEAVKEAKKKGAEVIEFSEEHANSKRVLPKMYNSVFDKREQKAQDLLAELVETSPNKSKRK